MAPDPLTYALLKEPLEAIPVDELEIQTGIDAATIRKAGAQTFTRSNTQTGEPPREYALVSKALLH
jgi:hypothetical protein